MHRTTSTRLASVLGACAVLQLGLAACSDDGVGDSAADTESSSTDTDPTGDGDGDPTGTDPTDTDPTGDGDGDGDGDTTDTDPTDTDPTDTDPTGDGDGDTDPTDTSGDGDGDAPCVYPDAAEPMALDQPIAAYAWPEALRNNLTSAPLSLEDAYCDSDQIIDWSPHDILVFISLPAW